MPCDKPTGKVECLYESLTDFHQFSKDNGPGIADHQKYLKFFKQLKPEIKESTGVGLSIVQKIIEEQGGTIRIESTAKAQVLFYNSK
jgi:nitrogen-specific signal transduction histidine kinase